MYCITSTLLCRIEVTLRLFFYSQKSWCYALIRVLRLFLYSKKNWCYVYSGVTFIKFLKTQGQNSPKNCKNSRFRKLHLPTVPKKHLKVPALIDLTELGDGVMNTKVSRLLIYSISSMVLRILKCYAY